MAWKYVAMGGENQLALRPVPNPAPTKATIPLLPTAPPEWRGTTPRCRGNLHSHRITSGQQALARPEPPRSAAPN